MFLEEADFQASRFDRAVLNGVVLKVNSGSALALAALREVAEALECQEGTVKSRVNRAKVRLKRQLSAVWNNEVSHAH